MKNFKAKDIKTLNAEINTLTVSVKGAVKVYADLVPHAIFHASNSEGASGRLTALNNILDALLLFKSGDKYITGLKKVVTLSIHKVKYDTTKKQFVFSETGNAAKKQRNLKEGFEKLNFMDYLPVKNTGNSSPLKAETIVKQFNKVLEQNENSYALIIDALKSFVHQSENQAEEGQSAFSLEDFKADLLSVFEDSEESEESEESGADLTIQDPEIMDTSKSA